MVVSTAFSRLKKILHATGVCSEWKRCEEFPPIVPLRKESTYNILNMQEPVSIHDEKDYVATLRHMLSRSFILIRIVFLE